jgi:hypothetical protein
MSAGAGLAGLEPLVGIPGTIGGALHGNAGSRGGDIGQWTCRAQIMTRDGEIVERQRDELVFAYRQSSLDELVILEAQFELEEEDPVEITKRMQKQWIVKKANLPMAHENTGCIFRNPRGMSAGMLIDQAGLKGERVGGAEVSLLELKNSLYKAGYLELVRKYCPGLTVRRCRVSDVIFGVTTASENSRDWYIADNILIGTNTTWYPRPRDYMTPSHTGVNAYGRGNVVCRNSITRFSDGIAPANYGPPPGDLEKQPVALDIYDNDVSWAQDDCIEHTCRPYATCINSLDCTIGRVCDGAAGSGVPRGSGEVRSCRQTGAGAPARTVLPRRPLRRRPALPRAVR